MKSKLAPMIEHLEKEYGYTSEDVREIVNRRNRNLQPHNDAVMTQLYQFGYEKKYPVQNTINNIYSNGINRMLVQTDRNGDYRIAAMLPEDNPYHKKEAVQMRIPSQELARTYFKG